MFISRRRRRLCRGHLRPRRMTSLRNLNPAAHDRRRRRPSLPVRMRRRKGKAPSPRFHPRRRKRSPRRWRRNRPPLFKIADYETSALDKMPTPALERPAINLRKSRSEAAPLRAASRIRRTVRNGAGAHCQSAALGPVRRSHRVRRPAASAGPRWLPHPGLAGAGLGPVAVYALKTDGPLTISVPPAFAKLPPSDLPNACLRARSLRKRCLPLR